MMQLCFEPPFFLRNPHIQTMISPLTRKSPPLPRAEKWIFETNGEVTLQGQFSPGADSGHLVLIYHGLGGRANSAYVVGAAIALQKVGFSVLRMALRGAEEEPPFVPAVYHAGMTEDIETAVKHAKNRGFTKIFILAFSLSANTVLKWLGQKAQPIEGAFLISPSIRLSTCAQSLDQWKNKIYQIYFLTKLKQIIWEKAELFPKEFSRFQKNEFFRTIRGYDDNVTAPLFGFKDSEDYYEQASTYKDLHKIQNHVAIVHSVDDPFVDSSDLQRTRNQLSSQLKVALLTHGGHVGFYQGLKKGYGVDVWARDYFQSLCL